MASGWAVTANGTSLGLTVKGHWPRLWLLQCFNTAHSYSVPGSRRDFCSGTSRLFAQIYLSQNMMGSRTARRSLLWGDACPLFLQRYYCRQSVFGEKIGAANSRDVVFGGRLAPGAYYVIRLLAIGILYRPQRLILQHRPKPRWGRRLLLLKKAVSMLQTS